MPERTLRQFAAALTRLRSAGGPQRHDRADGAAHVPRPSDRQHITLRGSHGMPGRELGPEGDGRVRDESGWLTPAAKTLQGLGRGRVR